MKIAIISKEDHAKSMVNMLRDDGHEIVLLGSRPTMVPPTVDLLICRSVSCSHGATDLALKWKRDGKKVIFDSGATRVKEEVDKLVPPRPQPQPQVSAPSPRPQQQTATPVKPPAAPASLTRQAFSATPATPASSATPATPASSATPATPASSPSPFPKRERSTRELVEQLFEGLGWFSSRLHSTQADVGRFPEPLRNTILDFRKDRTIQAARVGGLKIFGRGDDPVEGYESFNVYFTNKGWSYPTPVFGNPGLFTPEAKRKIANLLACTLEPQAQVTKLTPGKKHDTEQGTEEEMKEPIIISTPVAVTPTPTPVVVPTPTPTPVVVPTPTPTPVVTPVVVPTPVVTPVVVPTPTPTIRTMKEDLKALDAMCREIMERYHLTEFKVLSPGGTSFKRVVIEDGTLE
jgi:hypothetical protein